MKKGYLINEIHNKSFNTLYAIGIECEYEIKDGKLHFLDKPEIFFRLMDNSSIYIKLKNAEMRNEPSEDLKKFKKHLKALQEDDKYNKRIIQYFTELSKNEYPEDIFEGIYYEFNEY